jgi:predicted permease
MTLEQPLRNLGHDLKYATLSYRRARGVFFIIVMLVATGVAVNTLVFELCDAIIIRLLPVRQPGNLVQLTELRSGLPPRTIFPEEVYRQISDTGVSVYDVFAQADAALSFEESGRAERVYVQGVSGNYFSALGVGALRGRLPEPNENRVAVLCYDFWKREFSGDSSVIGQTIRVDGRLFQVIGVTPKGFNGTTIDRGPDVRIPLGDLNSYFTAIGQPLWVEVVARLRPGYSLNQAQQEIVPLVTRVIDQIGTGRYAFKSKFELEGIASGTSWLRKGFSFSLMVLLAGTGLLVLVVSSNVASLLLGRVLAGERDTAVRLALGATRRRIFYEWIIVGLVPTILGAVLGLLFAFVAAPLVANWIPAVRSAYDGIRPVSMDLRIDAYVIAFWLSATCVAALAAAVSPAWHAARCHFALALRTPVSSPAHGRMQEALSSFQLSMALIFIVVAGWLVGSLWKLRHIDTGMDVEHVITMSIDTQMNHYTVQQLRSFQENLLDRVRILPGVESAGLSQLPVLQGIGMVIAVVSPGAPASGPNAALNYVGDGYLESVGMRLMSGRLFQETDKQDNASLAPVVVNQTFARSFARSNDPIGWQFATGRVFSKPMYQIVGVVNDAKYRSVTDPIAPTFYIPGFDSATPPAAFVLNVRARGKPGGVLTSVRAVVRLLDPTLPIYHISTLAENVQNSLAPERFVATLALGVSVISVLLASVGLYGVLNQFVAGTRRDIGVRLALGARPGDIIGLVSWRLLPILTFGAVLGGVISFGIGRSIRALLFEVPLSDPWVYICAVVLLMLSAVGGAAIPTLRALRIQPAESLRQE